MRILYLTDGVPYPLTTGALRHYFLTSELAHRHDVTMVSMAQSDVSAGDRAAIEAFARLVVIPPARGHRLARPMQAAGRVLGWPSEPAQVRALAQVVRQLAAEEPYDVVVVSGKRTAGVLDRRLRIPVVSDMCDATSSRILGAMSLLPSAQKPRAWLQYQHVRRLERTMLRWSQRVCLATARDRDEVRRLHGWLDSTMTVVPNAVDHAYWQRSGRKLGADRIIFTGKMDYLPNEDAALHLARSIFPIVQRELPAVTLHLVGRDPTPAVRSLEGNPAVRVKGYVDDMRPHLEAASVFAAPLRMGAGIQNKLLEALSMEVPTVASTLAIEGLRAADGTAPPIAAADNPARFGELLITAIRSARADPRPHGEGRAYVERYFHWSRSAASLEDAIDEARRLAAA